MGLFEKIEKTEEIGKAYFSYKNEQRKNYTDPEMIELGKDLTKKVIKITDSKTNDAMDYITDKIQEEETKIKNGEDTFSKGKNIIKSGMKRAVSYADNIYTGESTIKESFEEEKQVKIRQKQELDELRRKHKQELRDLKNRTTKKIKIE